MPELADTLAADMHGLAVRFADAVHGLEQHLMTLIAKIEHTQQPIDSSDLSQLRDHVATCRDIANNTTATTAAAADVPVPAPIELPQVLPTEAQNPAPDAVPDAAPLAAPVPDVAGGDVLPTSSVPTTPG